MKNLILVTGAGGKTGRAVVGRLARGGCSVRALVRRREQLDQLLELGAHEAVIGDFRSLNSATKAMEHCAGVYHLCPNVHPDEVAIGEVVVSAAATAKVKRFVYHSVLQPQIEAMPHHWQKLRVEEILIRSGLDFTILQPAVYMQNLLADWDSLVERGVYARPYAVATRLSFVDLEDIAETALRILSEDGHSRAIYELCGTPWIDGVEVAGILATGLRRSVVPEVQSLREWRASAETRGLGQYQCDALLAMFRYYDRHGLGGSPVSLTHLLGRTPTSLAEFVQRHRAL